MLSPARSMRRPMKPDDIKHSRTLKERQFLIQVFYEGPWDRISCFCLGIYQDNRDELRWEMPDNPTGWLKLMSWLANYCDQRDQLWRYKYAVRKRTPRKVWRRGADTGRVQDAPATGEANSPATGGGVSLRVCRLDFPEQADSSDH